MSGKNPWNPLQVGLWPDLEALAKLNPPGRRFEPRLGDEQRAAKRAAWQRAVLAVIDFYARN